MFNGLWCYRYLLWNLVSRDFKLKYRRSVLGVVWSVLNPLLMCLVYWAVFSSLMDMRGSGIDNFPVFLMCGQLLFNFFNEATSTSMSSVLGAASLLKKVYIPKHVFPLEKCCFAMVNCVFSFVALALVMVFTGSPIHITVFEALYPLVTLFFFSLGVGLFLAAATVFFRDIMHIWSVFITALLYFSAIFYDPTQMTFSIGGFNMQQIIKLNPMYWYITGFRRTLMWGIPLDINMFLVCGLCAVVSMLVGVQMGDFLFQQKCEKRMKELMAGGTTVILVSHSIEQIERMCSKVAWLSHGHLKMNGDTETVCNAYKAVQRGEA